MRSLDGFSETGRVVSGPDQELVELEAVNGLKHMAIVFDVGVREHDCFTEGMDRVRGAMHQPGVAGLAPLVRDEPAHGSWVYGAGTGWTLAEVVRVLNRHGQSGSVRAGLELCYLASEVLLQASEIFEGVGIHAHGSLDPTRIQVKPDGQVCILGYALPPAALMVWNDDSRRKPHMDALRYAPPERFKVDEMEDLSSDLFSLTLVGLEMMVGRPVYDGLFDDVAAQARDGAAVRRVYGWRGQLPATVQEALVRALKPDRDARYRNGNDYVYAMHDLLSSVDAEGPSLREILAIFRGLSSRGRVEGAQPTGTFTREELAELTADLDSLEQTGLAAPSKPRTEGESEPEESPGVEEAGPRWESKSQREASRAKEERESRRDALRRSLKSRNRGGAEASEDSRDRLKRRVRRREPEDLEGTPAGANPTQRDRPRRLGARRTGMEQDESSLDEKTELAGDLDPPPEEVESAPHAPTVASEEPSEAAADMPEDASEPDAEPELSEETSTGGGNARSAATALLARLKNLGAPAAAPEPEPEPVTEVVPEPAPAPPPEPEVAAEAPVAHDTAAPPSPSADGRTLVLPDGSEVRVPSDIEGPRSAWMAVMSAGQMPLDVFGRVCRGVSLVGDRVSWVDSPEVVVRFSTEVGDSRTVFLSLGSQTPAGWACHTAVRALELDSGPWALSRDGAPVDPWSPIGSAPVVVVKGEPT